MKTTIIQITDNFKSSEFKFDVEVRETCGNGGHGDVIKIVEPSNYSGSNYR